MTLHADAALRQQLNDLSTLLRSTRIDAGLRRRSLAAELQVSTTALADWETCADDPTMSHLIRWASALGFRLAIVDPVGSPELSPARLDEGESWEEHEMRRLATALWARRRSRRMSQESLAVQIGVGRISMQRWESTQVFPRPIAFLAWARALECSVVLHAGNGPFPPDHFPEF